MKSAAYSLRSGIQPVAQGNDTLSQLPLTHAEKKALQPVLQQYPFQVSPHYFKQINWQDRSDPLRLQIIPQAAELTVAPTERFDPIGDQTYSPVERLTHRYPDRVLLYPTYQCAINCRFCFRKDYLSRCSTNQMHYQPDALAPAYHYIANHSAIREVILSGGDPLTLTDQQLKEIIRQLEQIPHLQALRIHTRLFVAQPQRITPAMARLFASRLQTTFVSHINHVQEISPATLQAVHLLRQQGYLILNQSVLLKGINDELATLRKLLQTLVYQLGIKPYYLHHCDMTRGLSHFRTPLDVGLQLMRQLRGHISGVCLPTYVLDLPGGRGKIPLETGYLQKRQGSQWHFTTYDGHNCLYTESNH